MLLVKTASPATYSAVGDVISYSYLVTNNGNVTLFGPFTVSDDLAADESCPDTVSLAPWASIVCTASYKITQADLDAGAVTNVASASGGGATSPTDTETVTAVPNKSLLLVKTASPATYSAVGDVISYSYLVTNNGNVTLFGPFTVSDDLAADESCPDTVSLAPWASIVCTASYKITQADLDAGAVTNVASASGGGATSPTDTETVTAVARKSLLLVKTASPATYSAVGDVISYSYLVTNNGNVTLFGPFTVSDDLAADESCPDTVSLAPWASIVCTASYKITQADLDAGAVTNVASASGGGATSPTDTETVTAVQDPKLTQTKVGVLDKTVVAPADRADAGDVINYTITAKNEGNVTLTNVTVVDPLLGALSCTPAQPATLLPGASIVCSGSYTLLQSDINAGERANTATADSDQTPPTDTPNVVPLPQDSKLTQTKVGVLDKTVVAPADRADAGDVINYTITAKNEGNVTLTNVTVVDPLLGALSCTPAQPATLLPGASIVCSGSYTLLQSDINAGERANTATADSDQTPPTDTPNVVPLPQDSKLTQTKVGVLDKTVVAPADRADAGDVINYTITAKNEGNVTLTNVTVVDPLLGALSCTPAQPATLLPGASIVCSGSYTLLQSDINAGERANTATADSDQTPPTDTPNVVPLPQDSKLTQTKVGVLDKTVVAPADRADAGDVINYTITAKNEGNVTLTNVTVVDPLLGALSCTPAQPATLLPGASIVCSGSYTLLQSDINAGERANTATADSDQTPPTDTPNVVPLPQDSKLTQTKVGVLDKTVVAPADRADAGDVINYTITAKNEGNVTLTNVTVVDPLLGALSCTPAQPATLLPGASIVCSGSYTLLQSDINAGERANTATADSDQTPPTDTPNVVPLPQEPAIDLVEDGFCHQYDSCRTGKPRRRGRQDHLQLRDQEHGQRDAGYGGTG